MVCCDPFVFTLLMVLFDYCFTFCSPNLSWNHYFPFDNLISFYYLIPFDSLSLFGCLRPFGCLLLFCHGFVILLCHGFVILFYRLGSLCFDSSTYFYFTILFAFSSLSILSTFRCPWLSWYRDEGRIDTYWLSFLIQRQWDLIQSWNTQYMWLVYLISLALSNSWSTCDCESFQSAPPTYSSQSLSSSSTQFTSPLSSQSVPSLTEISDAPLRPIRFCSDLVAGLMTLRKSIAWIIVSPSWPTSLISDFFSLMIINCSRSLSSNP